MKFVCKPVSQRVSEAISKKLLVTFDFGSISASRFDRAKLIWASKQLDIFKKRAVKLNFVSESIKKSHAIS